MGYLLFLLLVSGGIWWIIHRRMKMPSHVLCGIVVRKNFVKSESKDSEILVLTYKGEQVKVNFHTQDQCTCILLDEEECFHGRSQEYDARIRLNGPIVLETYECDDSPRTAKLVKFPEKLTDA